MVDRGGLENRCGCKVTEGSNPSLSAMYNTAVVWRDGRVVEGARLEIVYRVTPYRGFESLSLRHKITWGSSSTGRAPGSQSGGRGFDPHLLHHFLFECRSC